jgi:hypothetical protein
MGVQLSISHLELPVLKTLVFIVKPLPSIFIKFPPKELTEGETDEITGSKVTV